MAIYLFKTKLCSLHRLNITELSLNFGHLTELDLSHNKITSISSNLFQNSLNNLEQLTLSLTLSSISLQN